MSHQKRAVFLVEMLPVLLIMAVGGSLMAVGIASIQRSQKRMAESSNQYAVMNDFLRNLSQDVRLAKTASLQISDRATRQPVLVIGELPKTVSYRFYKNSVERIGFEGDHIASKRWEPLIATAKTVSAEAVLNTVIVNVVVFWHRVDAKDPEPDRRFDVTVRCAGELSR